MAQTPVQPHTTPRAAALKLAVIYLVVGGLWIIGSDRAVMLLFRGATPEQIGTVQTFKGWFFIAVTGGMLYVLAHRGLAALARSGAALRRSEQQLFRAQKLEAVGRLAGGVAHDFNNLLAVISGYAEMVERRAESGAPHTAAAAVQIVAATERGAALVRQLLAFCRGEQVEPRPVAVNALVTNLEPMLARLIGRHIEVRLDLVADVGSVMADPGQLEQVVVNLAINARDAMPGGGLLTIATRTGRAAEFAAGECAAGGPLLGRGDAPFVRLSVTDTGRGMDEATQARLFEPFFTTKGPAGTGLGLSIVYGIVQEADGRVCVESKERAGTRFDVWLPMMPAERGAGVGSRTAVVAGR